MIRWLVLWTRKNPGCYLSELWEGVPPSLPWYPYSQLVNYVPDKQTTRWLSGLYFAPGAEGSEVKEERWCRVFYGSKKWLNKIITLIRWNKKRNIDGESILHVCRCWSPHICTVSDGAQVDFPMAHCTEQTLLLKRSTPFSHSRRHTISLRKNNSNPKGFSHESFFLHC